MVKAQLSRLEPAARRLSAAVAPRLRTLGALPAPLRRGFLYAAAAAIVLALRLGYVRLEKDAAIREVPPPQATFAEGELGGNALRDGLLESGSTKEEAKAVLAALRPFGGGQRRYKGDRWRLSRAASGELQHVTLNRGTERIIVSRADEGKFKAALSKAPIQLLRKSASGTVKSSLWVSMLKAGLNDEIIQKYSEVFQWTVDFLTDTRDGDRFSMVWTERRTPDGRVWGRDVQAAVYQGRAAGHNVGILFDDAYYDVKAASLERMFLRAPLDYRRISSVFTNGRFHPILKTRRPHQGIDYAASRGTPVKAIGEGRVTALGWHGGFGKRIEIRHNGTYASLYGHLDRYASGLSGGERVRQGQVIGYVGSTGLATGPHLHFQFSRNGVWVNYAGLKLPKSKSVPPGRLEEFNRARDLWLRELGEPLPESAPASAGKAAVR